MHLHEVGLNRAIEGSSRRYVGGYYVAVQAVAAIISRVRTLGEATGYPGAADYVLDAWKSTGLRTKNYGPA